MATADDRLQRLLGGAALAGLRQRLRAHFERGGTAEGLLHLGQLLPDEREALALMTGRPAGTARSLRLDLADLQARLQAAGVASSLRGALERLDGPIPDRRADQAAVQVAWQAVQSQAGHDSRLHKWLQHGAALGLLKRLARRDPASAQRLLAQASGVLARLPAGGMPRAQLAAQALGDAHALDAGRPVATLVLAAWRHADALPVSGDAEERLRDVWARAGVLVNELARPALALNLPAHGRLGEPIYLSLRRLLRTPPSWDVGGRTVFVCENPNLLAIAADRLGARCAPLVCTDGMPAAAQRTLLQQLAQAGAWLRCRADFDWPGLRICNQLLRHANTLPWRMGAADYDAAAAAAAALAGAHHALAGTPADATWESQLGVTMRAHGRAIAEEAMADVLLEDLSPP